jgi:hypothetical protein
VRKRPWSRWTQGLMSYHMSYSQTASLWQIFELRVPLNTLVRPRTPTIRSIQSSDPIVIDQKNDRRKDFPIFNVTEGEFDRRMGAVHAVRSGKHHPGDSLNLTAHSSASARLLASSEFNTSNSAPNSPDSPHPSDSPPSPDSSRPPIMTSHVNHY